MEKLKQLSLYIFLALLAYMPLHIFLSTWIGTSFDVLPVAKVAKDVVLVVGFLTALIASINQPWFKALIKDKLVWLILAYFALTLILALIKPIDQDAEILGVVYNTRFLLFFLYGLLLSNLFDVRVLRQKALKIVLTTATAVLFFGIIQYTILPNDALTHVGYSRPNGVLPAFFIDDKPDLERIMSTVRDPNSLGSYLIAVISLLIGLYLVSPNNTYKRKVIIGYLVLAGLCLFWTFSRSAWLGMLITAAIFGAHWFKNSKKAKSIVGKYRITILALIFTVFLISITSFISFRNSYFVQNIIFHADQRTVLESSNQLRLRFLKESLNSIADEPLGHGVGTAGLASIRNDRQGVTLNENYFLQIGYEVGILGLIIFLLIVWCVSFRLYKRSKNLLALALFASFLGITLTNLLVHIWANEAVAYTWWGLAAVSGLLVNRE